MNIFRLLGDQLRLFALLLLVIKIIKARSCAGISGKTQFLLALECTTRYLDVATTYISTYNTSMKLLYISICYVTLSLIYVFYKKTYEHEYDVCRIEYLLIPAALLALLVNHGFEFLEVFWTFSIYLEAVAIIPQFLFILKSGEIDRVMVIYLCCMASSRGLFYVLNWAYRFQFENHYDLIAILSSAVETLIYCYFLIKCTSTIRRKKVYQKNLKLILNHPDNFNICEKGLKKKEQFVSDNQDIKEENDSRTNKICDAIEIPKVHTNKQ